MATRDSTAAPAGPTARKCTTAGAATAPPLPSSATTLVGNEMLFALYDRMLGDVELPAVLRDVAAVVCDELDAERATVFVIDRATEELESVAVIGNVTRKIRVPITRGSLAGYCAVSGRAFVVPDAYGDLSMVDPDVRFDQRWDAVNDYRTRDLLCAPAMFKGEVVGVVQAINSRRSRFTDADLQTLCTISRLIGYALYHARLYDDLATLKELERRKAEFVRVMVHELKSPVAGAKMMADALQYDKAIADTSAADVTQRISNRMAQLLGLIKDLLQLAMVKSGEALSDVAVFDLREEARRVTEQYRDQAEQKRLVLKLETLGEPVRTRIDSRGLTLVLSNLISNAVKYTPSGEVRVAVRAAQPWAIVEVKDTGIGIPADEVHRLFGEFFRASNAKQAEIEGSGVGLAGVKSLVERFGGELALDTRENEGSTFVVRLPLHQG